MRLYHGSNIEIESINLSLCQPYKDFGQGFYLTNIYEQAELMAKRKVNIMALGQPIVTTYLFDEHLLTDCNFKVIFFAKPSEKWALFVLENRRQLRDNFDIVVVPVANDGVAFQLERYVKGIIPLEILVEELTFKPMNNQYFFGTERAIKLLQKL